MLQPANFIALVVLAVLVLVLVAGPQEIDSIALVVNNNASRIGSGTDLASPGAEPSTTTGPESVTTAPPSFEVRIRRPSGPPLIELVTDDPQGRVAKVACTTCHSVRPPNLENRDDSTLDEFHQGLKVSHGKLACYACHNPDDADALRSADGTKIQFPDVMTLCSQCHGPQAESYAHGAHGGMNGFWDITRGPQMKNNCIDCHDPHAPTYPKMIVGFKPRDRFLGEESSDDDHQ